MKTKFQSKEEAEATRKWLIVDAENVALGRVATQVATLLRGKHKPTYVPHNDGGDFVIVLNASKVKLTGNKMEDKIYYRHSGYAGGLKETSARKMLETHPTRLLELAVKGMLPRGALGNQLAKKLKVCVGTEHNHDAQKPVEWKLVA